MKQYATIKTSNLELLRSMLALMLAAGMFASNASAAAVERSVIALYGDSITVGYHYLQYPVISGDEGWPTSDLVALMAASPKRSAIVDNWGVGASTSADGVNNMNSFLSQNTSKHSGKAYYVLIMYGTNDFNVGITASTTGFNNGQMVFKARELGYIPVVGTLTPRDDQNSRVIARNAEIVQPQNLQGATLVDHYSRFVNDPGGPFSLLETEPSSIPGKSPIRLHPTRDGYQVIAQTWFDAALSSLIEPDPDPKTVTIAPIMSYLLDE